MTRLNALALPLAAPAPAPGPAPLPDPCSPQRGLRVGRTLHFIQRAELRGLDDDAADFILTWGNEVHRGGLIFLTVQDRRLPREVRASRLAHRVRDWVVAYSSEGTLITCYRLRNAYHRLCARPKDGSAFRGRNPRRAIRERN